MLLVPKMRRILGQNADFGMGIVEVVSKPREVGNSWYSNTNNGIGIWTDISLKYSKNTMILRMDTTLLVTSFR